MISLFNGIVRRGHAPRESAIRRMMESLGLVVPTPAASDSENSTDDEESMESESDDADDCLVNISG